MRAPFAQNGHKPLKPPYNPLLNLSFLSLLVTFDPFDTLLAVRPSPFDTPARTALFVNGWCTCGASTGVYTGCMYGCTGRVYLPGCTGRGIPTRVYRAVYTRRCLSGCIYQEMPLGLFYTKGCLSGCSIPKVASRAHYTRRCLSGSLYQEMPLGL